MTATCTTVANRPALASVHAQTAQDALGDAAPEAGDLICAGPGEQAWKVTTETSSYIIDFANMTATRLPGDGGGCLPDLPEATVSDLRKDACPILMLETPTPVVGERMELWLRIREDGTPTFRHTTYVRSIEVLTSETHTGQESTS